MVGLAWCEWRMAWCEWAHGQLSQQSTSQPCQHFCAVVNRNVWIEPGVKAKYEWARCLIV